MLITVTSPPEWVQYCSDMDQADSMPRRKKVAEDVTRSLGCSLRVRVPVALSLPLALPWCILVSLRASNASRSGGSRTSHQGTQRCDLC